MAKKVVSSTNSVGDYFGKIPEQRVYDDDASLALSKCYLGVEVEAERVLDRPKGDDGAIFNSYWANHPDGSLRDSGLEFSFASPLFGRDVILALDELEIAAAKFKWEFNFRTGTHVHLDVRNLNEGQLGALATLYCILEGAFFQYAGPDRATSNFCVPWYSATSEIDAICSQLQKIGLGKKAAKVPVRREDGRADRVPSKYAALNFESLPRYGTVEFRALGGTASKARLLPWINMGLSLKRAALYRYASPAAVLEGITAGLDNFAERIFVEVPKEAYTYPGLTKDMERGLELAHRLVLSASDKPSENDLTSWF